MTKSKRSSLKSDPLYLRAFRVRAPSDVSRKSIDVVPEADVKHDSLESSPAPATTPQRQATIKLVEPSPPESSSSTVTSRTVSAESQKQASGSLQQATSSTQDGAGQPDEDNLKTPTKQSTSTKPTSASNTRTNPTSVPIYDLFTPSRPSNEHERDPQAQMGSDTLSPAGYNSTRAASPTSGSEDGSQWTSQIRSTGSMGKSTAHIEKLTAEKMALKRELKEKTFRLEEAQRTHETDRIAIQEARKSAERHQHLYETNQAMLDRRIRKADQLKEEVTLEKTRRETAERKERELAHMYKSETADMAKELALEKEKRLHYQIQYQILEQAYKKGRPPWQPQLDKLNKDMKNMALILSKLSTTQENASLHQAEAEQTHDQMMALFGEYKRTKNELLAPVAANINRNEEAADELLTQMQAALDKMRWVVAVKRDVKDAE